MVGFPNICCIYITYLATECKTILHNLFISLNKVESSVAEETEEEEEEMLKAPEQEVFLDKSRIMEEEKQAIPEFFEGRSSKTPERYLKIRNYILQQW